MRQIKKENSQNIKLCSFAALLRKCSQSKHGFTLAETLVAISIAAMVMITCAFGISSAIHASRAAVVKSTADALAETESEYIKNEIRFAQDIDSVIKSLSGHSTSLNDMSLSELTFETAPDGAVTFRFTVAEYEYEYVTIPLNRDLIP